MIPRPLVKEDFDKNFMDVINVFTRSPEIKTMEEFNEFFSEGTFVIEEDNKIVGSIKVVLEPKFHNNFTYMGHIEDVCVLPEYRKKRVATALVDWAIKFCKEKGCYKIVLSCKSDLVPLYEKSGFKESAVSMVIYNS
jgi:glucosamine-phosphate N-acetyltransferase